MLALSIILSAAIMANMLLTALPGPALNLTAQQPRCAPVECPTAAG
jgi:hypothetical protein